MSRFVIVVDAQRDFMMPDGALYVAGAEALVAPMNDMLASLSPVETAGVLLTRILCPLRRGRAVPAALRARQRRLADGARRHRHRSENPALHP